MDADFAYWPLNVGPKPGDGGDESYGMLTKEWTAKSEDDVRLNLMRRRVQLQPLPKHNWSQAEVGQGSGFVKN